MDKYNLQLRVYLRPTSMHSELAFVIPSFGQLPTDSTRVYPLIPMGSTHGYRRMPSHKAIANMGEPQQVFSSQAASDGFPVRGASLLGGKTPGFNFLALIGHELHNPRKDHVSVLPELCFEIPAIAMPVVISSALISDYDREWRPRVLGWR